MVVRVLPYIISIPDFHFNSSRGDFYILTEETQWKSQNAQNTSQFRISWGISKLFRSGLRCASVQFSCYGLPNSNSRSCCWEPTGAARTGVFPFDSPLRWVFCLSTSLVLHIKQACSSFLVFYFLLSIYCMNFLHYLFCVIALKTVGCFASVLRTVEKLLCLAFFSIFLYFTLKALSWGFFLMKYNHSTAHQKMINAAKYWQTKNSGRFISEEISCVYHMTSHIYTYGCRKCFFLTILKNDRVIPTSSSTGSGNSNRECLKVHSQPAILFSQNPCPTPLD